MLKFQQWVEVGARLPEVGQEVIIATEGLYFGLASLDSQGNWRDDDYCIIPFVTHWQPKPLEVSHQQRESSCAE